MTLKVMCATSPGTRRMFEDAHSPLALLEYFVFACTCAFTYIPVIPGASHPQNYSWILLQNSTIVHTRYKNSN